MMLATSKHVFKIKTCRNLLKNHELLKTVAAVLSIPLNKKKQNSQVNKLGVISKERSHVRNSEAVNLIPIHRAINHKQESFLSVTFFVTLLDYF